MPAEMVAMVALGPLEVPEVVAAWEHPAAINARPKVERAALAAMAALVELVAQAVAAQADLPLQSSVSIPTS